MATIKVACPKCGQKVSGDETFYGTVVECPICSADIRFPGRRREEPRPATRPIAPVPPDPGASQPPDPVDSPRHSPPTPEAASAPAPAAPPAPAAQSAPAAAAPADDELPPSPLRRARSIVSAVLSIVTCVGGVVFAPLAIIAGHTALAKARHSPVQPAPGHTLGAIGLMVGYVSLVLTILVLLALVLFGDSLRDLLPKGQE